MEIVDTSRSFSVDGDFLEMVLVVYMVGAWFLFDIFF